MGESNDNEPQWVQIGGDMDPGAHGGTVARIDSDAQTLEIREIQPVRAYIGDREAESVGFPFWSREAFFDWSDLDGSHPEDASALGCVGLVRLGDGRVMVPNDWEPMDAATSRLATAEAYLAYGLATDEGPCGWARDVVPGRVRWWGETAGPEYLADEDREYRLHCTLDAGVYAGLTLRPECGGYEDGVDLLEGVEAMLERIEAGDWPDEPMDWPEGWVDMVAALYHAMMDCHGGQWSEEYSLGCRLGRIYDPGPSHHPEDERGESMEWDLYAAACELMIPGSTEEE